MRDPKEKNNKNEEEEIFKEVILDKFPRIKKKMMKYFRWKKRNKEMSRHDNEEYQRQRENL